MKKFVYWLMGERASRTIAATWNWLWGMPVASGGKIAVEVAQESLWSMQQAVLQLAESVSTLVAAYQRAKEKYESKQQEFRQAEHQAKLAHRAGNEEAARMAMTKAILLEKLLPQLAVQVSQAEKVVMAAKEKLNRERQKIETHKFQMQNLKDMSEVNEALAAIAKIDSDLNIDSGRAQFEAAQAAVQHRHLQINAQAELSENPAEKLEDDLDRLTLDDEIARRLQHLGAANN